jgi:transposase-like protein
MSEIDTLFEELAQLVGQYKNEVPGGRKTWPRSIKARAQKLALLGLSAAKIARRTNVSYYTVYSWTKTAEKASAKGGFREIAVVPARAVAPAPKAPEARLELETVSGLRSGSFLLTAKSVTL